MTSATSISHASPQSRRRSASPLHDLHVVVLLSTAALSATTCPHGSVYRDRDIGPKRDCLHVVPIRTEMYLWRYLLRPFPSLWIVGVQRPDRPPRPIVGRAGEISAVGHATCALFLFVDICHPVDGERQSGNDRFLLTDVTGSLHFTCEVDKESTGVNVACIGISHDHIQGVSFSFNHGYCFYSTSQL